MNITVAHYNHDTDGFDLFHGAQTGASRSMLLFDPVLERSGRTLGDRFTRLDHVSRNADLLVVRAATPDAYEIIARDTPFQHAVGGLPLVILAAGHSPNGSHSITLIRYPKLALIENMPSPELLRSAELKALFERSGAWYSSKEYHFRLPSGNHATRFLRIANALRDVVDVKRMADWIGPYVTESTVIVSDTGTIMPLLIEMRERFRHTSNWDIPFECLDGYPTNFLNVQRKVDELLARPASKTDLLFLCSVSASGRMLSLFGNVAGAKTTRVAICSTGSRPSGSAVTLLHDPVSQSAGREDCVECEQSDVINVHPRNFDLVPGLRYMEKMLRWEVAESERCFWEAADRSGAVSLCVNAPYLRYNSNLSRHLALSIDPKKITQDEGFRRLCASELSKHDSPEVVVLPSHAGSDSVESVVRQVFPAAVFIRVQGSFDSTTRSQIAKARRILLADDSLITGETLTSFKNQIYMATQRAAQVPTLSCFVLISRPAGDAEGQAATLPFFTGPGKCPCTFGVTLCAPRPGAENCPWCRERQLLISAIASLSERAQIAARARILRLGTLTTPPILLGETQTDVDALLTRDSAFGELRRVPAFAACSCAVQRIRSSLRTLDDGLLVETVNTCRILHAYFEPIFFAAVLRTCDPRQLRSPRMEEELGRKIRGLDIKLAYPGTIEELGLAAAMGKVPAAPVKDLIDRALNEDVSDERRMVSEVLDWSIWGGTPASQYRNGR